MNGWIRATTALLLSLAACSSAESTAVPPDSSAAIPSSVPVTTSIRPSTTIATQPPPTSEPDATTTTATEATTTTIDDRTGTAPPEWLGRRPLPLRDGETNAIAQPTPTEFVDRQLWTADVLPPPPDDQFVSSITTPPPDDVLARSTFRGDCPVPASELAYAQVAFFGFDGRFHTGEFITRVAHSDSLVAIFGELHAMRFPIEEMVVTTQEAVDAHPTGDSNNTSCFVCRQAVNSGAWSRHAHGGAIDINPFHNPYVKGDLVIPELAGAYVDRADARVGMVTDEVVAMFARMGWGWGGNWNSAKDWMHFSDTGT